MDAPSSPEETDVLIILQKAFLVPESIESTIMSERVLGGQISAGFGGVSTIFRQEIKEQVAFVKAKFGNLFGLLTRSN